MCNLQTYTTAGSLIVTQTSVANTVVDFWRLVYENKCDTIVMLDEEDSQDEVGNICLNYGSPSILRFECNFIPIFNTNPFIQRYAPYWPRNAPGKYGPFVITPITVNRMDQMTISDFELRRKTKVHVYTNLL